MPGTRRVALRAAMVMSPDRGGVFDVLLRMARLGCGSGGRWRASTCPGSTTATSCGPSSCSWTATTSTGRSTWPRPGRCRNAT